MTCTIGSGEVESERKPWGQPTRSPLVLAEISPGRDGIKFKKIMMVLGPTRRKFSTKHKRSVCMSRTIANCGKCRKDKVEANELRRKLD